MKLLNASEKGLENSKNSQRLAALFTGGKDSSYAIHLARKQGHEIVYLITLRSRNPDSYMFHTPGIEVVELQAEAMELPIVLGGTEGEKEKELEDLKEVIVRAKEKYGFKGVLTGALFSEYQKSRIEKICDDLGLECVSPLWHKDPTEYMEELLEKRFKIVFTGVAAEGLDKSWLGKVIKVKELERLKELNKKIGLSVCGEGGEFESLVIDCPLFKKRLVLEEVEVVEENKYTAKLIIKRAKLENKE